VAGAGALVKSALCAVLAGVAFTFGTLWLIQALGPSGREEAVVEAVDDGGGEWQPGTQRPTGEVRARHLVLRTASGERFEAWVKDRRLSVSPGTSLQVEISDVGREVQAIEVDGRRVAAETGDGGTFLVGLVALGMLGAAFGWASESDRPILVGPVVVAGLAAGALPVLLLF
jgi:hypothetical protein